MWLVSVSKTCRCLTIQFLRCPGYAERATVLVPNAKTAAHPSAILVIGPPAHRGTLHVERDDRKKEATSGHART